MHYILLLPVGILLLFYMTSTLCWPWLYDLQQARGHVSMCLIRAKCKCDTEVKGVIIHIKPSVHAVGASTSTGTLKVGPPSITDWDLY